jgi:hypothetical protein
MAMRDALQGGGLYLPESRHHVLRARSGLELPGRLNGPLQALDFLCFRQPHSSASERGVELRNSGVDLAYNTLK